MISDPLVVALTRPTTFYGIPQKLLMAELFLSMTAALYANAFLKSASPKLGFVIAATGGALLFASMLFISKRITRSDENRFSVLFVALKKTPRLINYAFWGKVNSFGAN